MKTLTAFFKKLHLGRILSVFFAGVLLLVSTACNNGDMRGARPDNPTVQVGGMNNPHKGGGDGYTTYKMTEDAKVNTSQANTHRKSADARLTPDKLIAAAVGGDTTTTEANPNARLLYPGSDSLKTDRFSDNLAGDDSLLENPGRIPEQRQPVFDRSDPNAQLLERAGAVFQDASAFLKDKTQDAARDREHS